MESIPTTALLAVCALHRAPTAETQRPAKGAAKGTRKRENGAKIGAVSNGRFGCEKVCVCVRGFFSTYFSLFSPYSIAFTLLGATYFCPVFPFAGSLCCSLTPKQTPTINKMSPARCRARTEKRQSFDSFVALCLHALRWGRGPPGCSCGFVHKGPNGYRTKVIYWGGAIQDGASCSDAPFGMHHWAWHVSEGQMSRMNGTGARPADVFASPD